LLFISLPEIKLNKMNNCSQCGSSIPDGQRICSMCMGDINHGSDGYYQQWTEEQMAEVQAEQEAKAAQAQYEAEQNARGQAEADAAQYGGGW
jgi:predicted amidophosphoribosyltransferase